MAAPDGDRFSRRAGSILFPACGLQGVDPASGVEYVDFAEIDAVLCEPFLEMFVQDEGLAAVHYFSLVQEVVLPGVSSFLGGLKDVNAKLSKLTCKERVLVVGSHVLYLCDPSGLFVRTLLLQNIKELVSGRDGVGIRMVDPLYPDILVKAPDPTRLQHVLGRLYEAETGRPLSARECSSVRGELRFDSATPSGVRMPCKIIPLRVVRRDDPSMVSSSGYPERLQLSFAGGDPLSDAQAAVVGTYAIQPEYQDCLPKWKKVAAAAPGTTAPLSDRAAAAAAVPTEVWGCNGGWVVSSLPATVSNILFKSVELAGRSSPHAVGEWEELTEEQVFVPAPRLLVSAGGAEDGDFLAAAAEGSPSLLEDASPATATASVSSPRRGLSAAPTFSPVSGERRHARKSMIHPCSLGRALGAAAPVASIAASGGGGGGGGGALGSSASDAPPTCLSPFSNASDVSGLVRPTVPRALTDSPSPPAVVSGVLSPTLPRVLLESTVAPAGAGSATLPVAADVSPDHDPMMSPSFASELLLGPSAAASGREASASMSPPPPLPPGGEVQQASQRVELLRQRAAATAAKVQRLRRIEDDVAADRAALAARLALPAEAAATPSPPSGRVPQLAPHVEAAAGRLLRGSDEAERRLVAARAERQQAAAALEAGHGRREALRLQTEAARSFRSDSEAQLQTVVRCVQDIVQRGQHAAQAKEEALRAAADAASARAADARTAEAVREEELAPLRAAAAAAEEEAPREAAEADLREVLAKAEAERARLEARVAAVEGGRRGGGGGDLAETCSRLSVAIGKIDALSEEVQNSCALRCSLEEKGREVAEKDENVRRAILALKSVRLAYDQHVASTAETLASRHDELAAAQRAAAAAAQRTSSTVASLAATRKRAAEGARERLRQAGAAAAALEEEAEAREERLRWAGEQRLLLARCGSPTGRRREASASRTAEVSRRQQDLSSMVQDADKELLALQGSVIACDEKLADMRQKRDATKAALLRQEKEVSQSGGILEEQRMV